jgi:hypothetical protein
MAARGGGTTRRPTGRSNGFASGLSGGRFRDPDALEKLRRLRLVQATGEQWLAVDLDDAVSG